MFIEVGDFIAGEEKNSNYFGSGFIDDVCVHTAE